MLRPDYQHSIVNLMASMAGPAAPATALYPPLTELEGLHIRNRPVALFLIDGLGDNLLARHPDSLLARYRQRRLTSVFPSTTATAVTAYATGVPAQQHAITGWFTYFRELGCVATTLPFIPRCGGRSFSESGITPSDLIDSAPILGRFGRPVTAVTPHYISESDYSRALYPDVTRAGHGDLNSLFSLTADGLQDRLNPLVFAYWTDLDRLSHLYGVDSEEVEHHFQILEQGFERFLDQLRGSDTLVVVSADHGLIDTAPDRVLALEQHPQLEEMLVLPLCGEPRAAFCYVRAGRQADFEAYVREELAESCTLHASEDLVAQGLFGRGEPSPRLRERIGDYVLLPRDNWVIKDRLASEREFNLVGVHGGLSEAELYVPLIAFEP